MFFLFRPDFTLLLNEARASLMGSGEYSRTLQAYQNRVVTISPPQGKRVKTAESNVATRFSTPSPVGAWPTLSDVFAEAERIIICQSARRVSFY